MSSRKENSPALFYSFAKQRLTRRGRLKRQAPYRHLPYLSVCLKDLRLTCPGLASGTVKLNSFTNQNLRLEESDGPLNNRNLGQKEQPYKRSEYLGHCSCNWDRTIFETPLTPQSLQFQEEMQVEDILSQHALKDNCDQPPSLIHPTIEYRTSKLACTVISKKQGKVAVNDQNKNAFVLQNLMEIFNDKIKYKRIFRKTTISQNLYNNERKRIHGVKYGNLIKHFINNVRLNDSSFVEIFNQHQKSIDAKIMQTRFRKRQKNLLSTLKSPGCALSRHQSLEIKREIKGLIETFRNKIASHEKNLKKPARHTNEIKNYIKGHPSFTSESDYSINAQAPTKVGEHVTHLPHTNRRIILKNDKTANNCHKVPDHLTHSAPQKHIDKTKAIEIHEALETQENALKTCCNMEKSKTRNNSAQFYSLQNSGHLFCKCTLNQISGMLNYRNHKTANLPNNKAHLLVVVDRLKDSNQLNYILSRGPNSPQCETRSTSNCNVERHECGLWRGKPDRLVSQKVFSVMPQIRTSVKNKDILNSNSSMVLAENKQGTTTEREISTLYPLTRVSSPIKVMFVSKISRDDGIHYTLSPEYKPSNSRNAMENPVCSKGEIINKRNVSASNFCQSQEYNKTRRTNRLVQHTSLAKIQSKEEWFVKRNPEGPNTISAHSLKLVRRTPVMATNLQMNLSKHFGKLSKYKTSKGLLRFNTKKSIIARRGIGIVQRILLMSHKLSATQIGNRNKPLSDGCNKITEPKQICSSQSKVKTAKQTYSNPSLTINKNTSKSVSPFGHKLIIAKKDKKWHCRQSSQKPIKPKKKRNVRSSLFRTYQLCQQHAKFKRPVLHSLASLTTFSFRSAMHHHYNRISSSRRKLKNKNKPFNQQSNSGSVTSTCENTVNNSTGFTLEGAPDIQSSQVLNWWSTSASNESLLKELDNRYEKMASTWVHENNRGKRKMEISGETLKNPSPIQMLFQKKMDFKHISAWFMQTTETQSLSITRKANVHNLPKKKLKGTKCKSSKVHQRKLTRKCAHLATSDTSKEKQLFTSLSQLEHFCTRNVKYVKPGVLQHKYSSQGKKKLCHNICLAKLDASSRNMNVVETVLHSNNSLSETLVGSNSKVKKTEDLWKNEQTKQMKTYNSTKIQEIKDIRICLKRLNNNSSEVPNKNLFLERVQFTNANKVNKRPLRSNYCLKSKIQSLEINDCHAKPFNTTPKGKRFPEKQVCLSNSQREESHSSPRFAPLSKRKRFEQTSVNTETGSKKCKTQYSAHEQSYFSKLQLVPLKPVGLKSFQGLSSKDGSFSLTPIRIPSHRSKKKRQSGNPLCGARFLLPAFLIKDSQGGEIECRTMDHCPVTISASGVSVTGPLTVTTAPPAGQFLISLTTKRKNWKELRKVSKQNIGAASLSPDYLVVKLIRNGPTEPVAAAK